MHSQRCRDKHLTSHRRQQKIENGWPKSIFHDTQPESVNVSTFAFRCLNCACHYAFHSLLSLRMPSVHFTVYFPRACICALLFCTCPFNCPISLRMPRCVSLSTFPAHASMRFAVYFPCTCIFALHSALALRMPLRVPLSTFPAHASMRFTARSPYACLYAFHSVLAHASMFSPSTLRTSMRFTVCCPCARTLHFILYLPYACIYAFHSLLSLRMPLCASLCTCPAHALMRFTINSVHASNTKQKEKQKQIDDNITHYISTPTSSHTTTC